MLNNNRNQQWKPRKGLEGPFFYVTGAILYYDPKQGQYWDPTTDFYVSQEDVNYLHEQTVKLLAR